MKNLLTFFKVVAMAAIGYFATDYLIAKNIQRGNTLADQANKTSPSHRSSTQGDTPTPHRVDTPTTGQHRRERIIELENGNISVTAKTLELLKIPVFDFAGNLDKAQLLPLGITEEQIQHTHTLMNAEALAFRDRIQQALATADLPDGETLHIEPDEEKSNEIKQKLISDITHQIPGPLGEWLAQRVLAQRAKYNGTFGAHPIKVTRTTNPEGKKHITVEFPTNPSTPLAIRLFEPNLRIKWELE